MRNKPLLLRITTVPISLKILLNGQLTFFQQQGFEVITVSAAGPELSDLAALQIKHTIVPMTRTISPVQDLFCLWKLINIMRKLKPDIVHTHTPKAGLLGMMAALLSHVPVRMHTVAGLPLMEAKGLKRWVLKVTEWLTYTCATFVYPNSKGLQDFILHEFKIQPQTLIRSKLKIIGKGSTNGIDTHYFSRKPDLEQQATAIRQQFAVDSKEMVYCFVGRLVQDKGIVELVTAFQEIANKLPCRLLLVGAFEETLDPLPKEIMEFLKHDSRVILAGFQNDVRPWMMSSNVFVFPSYREGFPNVVMQAACLEIPCIVSDINGCNEMIEHGKTGWLVPPKDKLRLFEAMQEATTETKKVKALAIAARAFVLANFNHEYVWQELLIEYQRQLKTVEKYS